MKRLLLDDFDETLVRRINTMAFLASEFPKSVGYRRDAGLALLMLRGDRPGQLWTRIVRERCKISRRTAYTWMQIAAGKSLEALRRVERDRKRKRRANKWLPTKAPRLNGSK